MNITAIARYVIGAIFLVFGANKFIDFMPAPELGGAAGEFMAGLSAAPYFWKVLGLVEMAGGLMLLSGRFVPLGITLLAGPITQILLFHLFLAPDPVSLTIAFALTLGAILIARGYRTAFAGVLDAGAKPS